MVEELDGSEAEGVVVVPSHLQSSAAVPLSKVPIPKCLNGALQ